jgi:hypothetical protein
MTLVLMLMQMISLVPLQIRRFGKQKSMPSSSLILKNWVGEYLGFKEFLLLSITNFCSLVLGVSRKRQRFLSETWRMRFFKRL